MRRLIFIAALASVACQDPGTDPTTGDDGPAGGKADEAIDGTEDFEINACTITNRSGFAVTPDDLTDPIAELVLRAEGDCIQSMSDMLAHLEEVDGDGCQAKTALVNEYAQLMGEGSSAEARAARSQFRAVTLRPCNGRQAHELAFSTGGRPITRVADVRQNLDNYKDDLPVDVQIVAFDPRGGDDAAGVFNYYNLLGGEWNFFGNSEQFTLNGSGPELEDGPRIRDCAECHVSGDLIMKELDSPWAHWEGQVDTPGAEKLFENRPQLGERISGKALEDIVGGEKVAGVREGGFINHANPIRVKQMLAYDCAAECDGSDSCEESCNADVTYALLEPLFCSVTANLANSPNAFPENMIVHPAWAPEGEDSAFGGFPRPTIDAEEAQSYIDDNNQRISTQIAGRFSTRVTSRQTVPDASDTFFPAIHPVVAEVDAHYVQELLRQDVISEDFLYDVLFVDYSRPLFSAQRCDLLEDFVPALEVGKRTKILIKRGFQDALNDASSLNGAEGDFLASLDDSSDSDNHRADVRAFLEACSVRSGLDPETFNVDADDSRKFTREIMALMSATRARGRNEMLLLRQFPASMPIDDVEEDLQDNLARIHLSTNPNTLCKLNGLPSGFSP